MIWSLVNGQSNETLEKNNIDSLKSSSLLSLLFRLRWKNVNKKTNPIKNGIKNTFPFVYNNLDLVGFRVYVDPNPEMKISQEEIDSILKLKFMSHIAYLLVAIYLSNLYTNMKKEDKGEQQYDNKFYFDVVQLKDSEDADKSANEGFKLATIEQVAQYQSQVEDTLR